MSRELFLNTLKEALNFQPAGMVWVKVVIFVMFLIKISWLLRLNYATLGCCYFGIS